MRSGRRFPGRRPRGSARRAAEHRAVPSRRRLGAGNAGDQRSTARLGPRVPQPPHDRTRRRGPYRPALGGARRPGAPQPTTPLQRSQAARLVVLGRMQSPRGGDGTVPVPVPERRATHGGPGPGGSGPQTRVRAPGERPVPRAGSAHRILGRAGPQRPTVAQPTLGVRGGSQRPGAGPPADPAGTSVLLAPDTSAPQCRRPSGRHAVVRVVACSAAGLAEPRGHACQVLDCAATPTGSWRRRRGPVIRLRPGSDLCWCGDRSRSRSVSTVGRARRRRIVRGPRRQCPTGPVDRLRGSAARDARQRCRIPDGGSHRPPPGVGPPGETRSGTVGGI